MTRCPGALGAGASWAKRFNAKPSSRYWLPFFAGGDSGRGEFAPEPVVLLGGGGVTLRIGALPVVAGAGAVLLAVLLPL